MQTPSTEPTLTVREQIERSARLIMQPGDVHEVRIPKSGWAGTIAGYFDDASTLAAAVQPYDGRVPAIYLSLNPCNPALLARASNRLKERAQNTTSDRDIIRRRWLLVDCDPKRPSSISSSNAEHDSAIAAANSIAYELSEEGFPEPVVADSGNGAHLLYRIDGSNSESVNAQVDVLLKVLSTKFAPEDVAVDVSVGNAARITKLYGTLTGKGDSTPERPHRRSGILRVPDSLLSVDLCAPANPMARFIENWGAPESRIILPQSVSGMGSLEIYLANSGIQVLKRKVANGWEFFEIDCPFNPEHRGGSTCAMQNASTGALAFKCHHNSCAGKRWTDFRAVIDSRSPGPALYSNTLTLG